MMSTRKQLVVIIFSFSLRAINQSASGKLVMVLLNESFDSNIASTLLAWDLDQAPWYIEFSRSTLKMERRFDLSCPTRVHLHCIVDRNSRAESISSDVNLRTKATAQFIVLEARAVTPQRVGHVIFHSLTSLQLRRISIIDNWI